MTDVERELSEGFEDDAKLFNSAMSDEEPQEAPQAEEHDDSPPRDEMGRFAPKTAAQETETEARQTEEPPVEPQKEREPAIPPHRLREESERARAAEERARQLETMLMQFMQRQQAQPPQPASPPPKPPDIWDNPDEWLAYRQREAVTPVAEQMREMQMYMAREVATLRYSEAEVTEAEKAFNDAVMSGQMDPAEHARINGSQNPFASAIEWHRSKKVLKEVGSDPSAYKAKILEEAMQNPEFVAKVIEAQRSAGQKPGAPPNLTRLPPSLTRASGKSASGDADQFDDSDAGILRSALRR